MSDLIAKCQLSDSKDCEAFSEKPTHEKLTTRNAELGEGLTIRRALPHSARRMIGAWCFLDHFGPLDLSKNKGLDIAPHPHMGLQTFTWPIQGEILHQDSLGYEQVIKPGEINLMTAGKGISHSEESVSKDMLHGVQLWIALPDVVRNMEPAFSHYSNPPQLEQDGATFTLLAGEFLNLHSTLNLHSPLFGINIFSHQDTITTFPVRPDFEYGVLVLDKYIQIEKEIISPGTLLYLGCGRKEIAIKMPKNAITIMIGGTPFTEEVLLWWNFVGRTREDMLIATHDWQTNNRFGTVKNYKGGRLIAPDVAKIK